MKLFLILFLILFSPTQQKTVQDPEARQILEAFSQKAKKSKGIKMSFILIVENHQDNSSNKTKGELWLKGDRYRLVLDKTVTYYDGKNVFTYMPEAKEVTISKPSAKDDDLFIRNPSKIFNVYEQSFKFRFLGTTTYNRKKCYEIDLYPYDLNKSYSIIKLIIEEDTYQLVATKMVMKAGIHYIIYIEKYDSDAQLNDKDFTFDIKSVKDVEVVDLR